MRIIAFSDQHYDNRRNIERNIAISKSICEIGGDVLLFGGDMGETPEQIMLGFAALERFPGRKLWYLGNNDLEALTKSQLGSHHEELAKLGERYGFHLLDKSPILVDIVGFVGSVGWYDGSLFNKPDYTPLADRAEIMRDSQLWFPQFHPPQGMTEEMFFDATLQRCKSQLDEIAQQTQRIVLGIHHVPSHDFVLHGASPQYDKRNYWMGSTKLGDLYQHPAVVLGLTGHTHRSDTHLVGQKYVHNISTTHDLPWQEFTI